MIRKQPVLFTSTITVLSLLTTIGCGTREITTGSASNTTSTNIVSSSVPANSSRSTGKQSTNSTSTNDYASTPIPLGSGPIVAQAAQYVAKRTHIAVEAPTDIAPKSRKDYLSAQAKVNQSSYNVALWYTTTRLGVNSPKIDALPNGGLASLVGYFGGQHYPTVNKAQKSLLVNFFQASGSSNPKKIKLGHGTVGTYYGYSQNSGFINWHQGSWVFQVNNGTTSSNITLAKQFVAYLQSHPLPAKQGSINVMNAGDGEHTCIRWESGQTVYNYCNYHHALLAIRSANSLKPYNATSASGFK